MRIVPLALGLVLVVASATSGQAQDQKQTDSLDKAKAEKVQEPKKPKIKRDANRISLEEIESLRESFTDMYSLIQHARSRWLTSRGVSRNERPPLAMVFLDGHKFGELESLRSISSTQITEARWMSATDAIVYYGRDYTGGIILLKSSSGGSGG